MKNSKFNCTRQELIAACILGWESCAQNIDKFSNFKVKYSPEFLEARKDEIKKVMSLPDMGSRSAKREILRNKLLALLELCLSAWRKVSSHVDLAWRDDPDLGAMQKNLGADSYSLAYKNKYDEALKMMAAAADFITENKQVLVMNDNMHPDYETEFKQLYDNYSAVYAEYLEVTKLRSAYTIQVRDAYNKLYTDLMEMYKDGRIIFKKDPVVREYFVFTNTLGYIGGTNWAGIKGTVLDQSNRQLIPNLLIEIVETEQSTTTDASGDYSFGPLAAGEYTLRISAPDFHTKTEIGVKVDKGSYTLKDFFLEPMQVA